MITFTKPGRYAYRCLVHDHANQGGIIMRLAAGGAALSGRDATDAFWRLYQSRSETRAAVTRRSHA
jgi:hypothetical protein